MRPGSILVGGPAYRMPTVTEAVRHVMGSLTRDYRRDCIKYWRENYGDSFSSAVEREVEKEWAKKKAKRNESIT